MVSLDKEKQKRLKEAKTLYEKSLKAFQKGDISKEELKDRLRPYKYELKELGYPVKIKDDAQSPPGPQVTTKGPENASTEAMVEVPSDPAGPRVLNITPWSRRSQLTLEEMEKRIDAISLSKRPSEGLRSRYQSRYGEELEPPLDLVPYTPSTHPIAQQSQQPSQGAASQDDAPQADEGARKPFWKGLFKGRRKERTTSV